MIREDDDITRLRVAYDTLKARGELGKLPSDLGGDAITQLATKHEADAATYKSDTLKQEKARTDLRTVLAGTKATLSRLRHAVLLAYPDRADPRLSAFGPLGPKNATDREALGRLRAQAEVLRAAVTRGEVAVTADLSPDKIDAQVQAHTNALAARNAAVAARQESGDTLAQARKASRAALQLVRHTLRVAKGPLGPAGYGFDVPKPPVRHRKKAGTAQGTGTPPGPGGTAATGAAHGTGTAPKAAAGAGVTPTTTTAQGAGTTQPADAVHPAQPAQAAGSGHAPGT